MDWEWWTFASINMPLVFHFFLRHFLSVILKGGHVPCRQRAKIIFTYLYHEVSLRFNRLPVLLQRFFPMVLSSPGVPVTLVEAVEKWNHYDRWVGWWKFWDPTQTRVDFLG